MNQNGISDVQITDSLIEKIFNKHIDCFDLMENSTVLFAIADDKGYLNYVNKEWEKILGFSRREITNTPFMELIHPEDKKNTEDVYYNGEQFNPEAKQTRWFHNRYRTNRGDYAKLCWFSTGNNINGKNLAIAIFEGYE